MNYGITVRVSREFTSTVERVRSAGKDQGFGALKNGYRRSSHEPALRARVDLELDGMLIVQCP